MKKILTVIFILTVWAGNAQIKKAAQQQKQAPVEVPKHDKPQDQASQQVNPLVAHFLKKYTLATRWNDPVAAKEALYDLIAETGNDSLAYTLAIYYYENQQFAPSVLISKDLLARSPKNVNILNLSGSSYEGLGLKEKALPDYETLYLLTNSTPVLYKMATLQFDVKRFAECQANVDILMTKPDVDSLKVSANNAEKKPTQYGLKVALLNLKGLLAQQAGNAALARKSFSEALAIAPDFVMAKENLAKMK